MPAEGMYTGPALRIVYVGNYQRPWTSETHYARALRDAGQTVIVAQEGQNPAITIGELDTADLLLWQRTPRLADEADQTQILEAAHRRGIPTVGYHHDRYWDTEREAEVGVAPFWHVDLMFTSDGNPSSQERFEAAGVHHHWLRAACVHDEIGAGRVRRHLRTHIGFVGIHDRDRYHEWPWRFDMLDALDAHYGPMFKRWPRQPSSPVRGRDLNDLYASTNMMVGDSLFAGTPHGAFYWSDRIYETLGRGGFLIHPHIEGLDLEFTDGEHYVTFEAGDIDALVAVIDRWADDPAGRSRIRRQAMDRVRERCTYTHRAHTMLATLVDHHMA